MGNEPGTTGSTGVMQNHQQYAHHPNYHSKSRPQSSAASQRARGSSSNAQNGVNPRSSHHPSTQNASNRRGGRRSKSDDDFKSCSPRNNGHEHFKQNQQGQAHRSSRSQIAHQTQRQSASTSSSRPNKGNRQSNTKPQTLTTDNEWNSSLHAPNPVLSDSSVTSVGSSHSGSSKESGHYLSTSSNSKSAESTKSSQTMKSSKPKPSGHYPSTSSNSNEPQNPQNVPKQQNQKKAQNVSFRLSTTMSTEDFVIMKQIGKGSFGVVFQIKMKRNNKIYACKRLNKKDLVARKQVAHTNTERRVLANIDHPFIVSLRFAFQTKSKLYMLMDYHCGGELFFHLQKEGKFSEARCRFYAAEICLAIECLHSNGITYRDLKPENILLDFDGHIKITDFGLSKEVTSSPDSITRTFCGSPEYLAPEMLLQKGYDHGVDWWAFGTIVYEMLVGTPPFYTQDIQQMYRNILSRQVTFYQGMSKESMMLIQGLLQKDPVHRWQCVEIKKCAFFRSIHWQKLYRKEVEPPVRPQVLSESDTQNFEHFSLNSKSNKHGTYLMQTPSFVSHSLLAAQDQFPNFTYDETQDKVLSADSTSDHAK